MNYLISGSCGFLGTNLSKYLLNRGHKVYGIDNFSTGDVANHSFLSRYKYFGFVEGDICDFREENYPKDIDYIFNLACPASPKHYGVAPLETMDTCYIGLKNLLETASKRKIPLFQSSTSEIYGDALVSPQSEDYYGNVNSFGPRSCYDCGKRIGESLCYEYSRNGTKIHLGRIFNTYGPLMRVDDGRVISEFIINALQNENLIIYGDGQSTRSFCYVDDMIEAFKVFSESSVYGKPINLGNPGEFTLQELAETIIHKTESKSKIIYEDFKKDDPKKRKPDIDRAFQELKWTPKISLEDGLDKTIAYFKTKI